MTTRIGLVAAWVVATGLVTAIAWQVVGAADDQVSDGPMTPVIAVTTPASNPDTTPATGGTTPTSDGTVGTSSSTPTTTGDTLGSTTSTSSPSSTSSTTSTTSTTPSSSTSTTTTGIPATTTAVSDGGTVTVTGTEPAVELVAVVAAPGWTYQVTGNDGDRVEVRFENAAGDDIRVRCEWENGKLVADIDD